MKLTAAKCPNCGANLEVDRNEEVTTCKYCNSDIIIEDAVAKYKLELSGKVKVSGIKDNDDRLKDAKNYLKLKEYQNANVVIDTIIELDPFNIEAFILRIKSYLGYFGELYDEDDFETDCDLNMQFWSDVKLILDTFDRLKSIDEKAKYKKKLKDEIKQIEKLEKEQKKMNDDLNVCYDIDEMVEEITSYKFKPEISKALKRNYKKINKLLKAYFINTLGYEIIKVPEDRFIYRDMTIRYYDSNSRANTNVIKKYQDVREVEKAIRESKDDIINKMFRVARGSSPIGIIKNIIDK